jgi:DNA-directed RNA polymerase subunit E'/Rpb7
MNNFIDIKIQDVVKIAPFLLNSDYKNNILKILKSKYEGLCSKFGYIKQNSIRIVKITKGTIELSTFHGYVLFDVDFMSSICNPAKGSIVRCKVQNINAFGVLCTSGIIEDGTYHNILNIIIPKQNSQLIDNSEVAENVVINDEVNVEILGKKYILNNKNINVFGKIIDNNTTADANLDSYNNGLELDEEEDVLDGDTGLDEDDNENENEDENDDEKTEKGSIFTENVEDIPDEDPPDEDDGVSDVESDAGSDFY